MVKGGRPKREDGRNAHNVATIKYAKDNYDRITVQTYKGQRDIVREYAKSKGLTTNILINSLLAKEIEGFKPIDKKD